MKATDLLETQHRKVEAIFEKLEGGRSDPTDLLEELAKNLAAHMAIEQELFYPAVKELDPEMVNESYEEHAIAELALKRLLGTNSEHEAFAARVTALKELIEHHVEEEEQELFPKVEKKADAEMLSELAKRMKARFQEAYQAGFEAAVPKGLPKTSADASRKAVARSNGRRAAHSA